MKNDTPIEQLKSIMAKLRDPDGGCPWDLEQDFQSIAPHTLEEAYEVVDAIERKDFVHLREELGDLLLQVIFYAQMAKEEGHFTFDDIVNTLNTKLINRHPHVFGDTEIKTAAEQEDFWDTLKEKERQAKNPTDNPENKPFLDDIPKNFPALVLAYKIQKRAASVGFDWPDVSGAFDKAAEELDEIQAELKQDPTNQQRLEEEIGDALFALCNVARKSGVKPEDALRKGCHKFIGRFTQMEQLASGDDKSVKNMSLEEMDQLWERIKLRGQRVVHPLKNA